MSTRYFVFAAAVAVALSTTACASRLDTRGNLPDPERVAEIKPGEQTREDVADILGSPSSVTPFGSDTWYYISKRTETFAFFAPKLTDRQIVMIKFGGDGKVAGVDTIGIDASRLINPVERTTPTHGTEMTVLEQFVGNLGRFRKNNQKKKPETLEPNAPDPNDR
jgi:outer membrane protein assembly factor BamE (lipoprotein component of BamABCDE complex)